LYHRFYFMRVGNCENTVDSNSSNPAPKILKSLDPAQVHAAFAGVENPADLTGADVTACFSYGQSATPTNLTLREGCAGTVRAGYVAADEMEA
jgi:hypothetical protein